MKRRAGLVASGLTCFAATLCIGCASPGGGPAGGAVVTAAAELSPALSWDFEDQMPGRPPSGWSIRQTNPTTALATWHIQQDVAAPSGSQVFALIGSGNYDGTYNLAIAEGTNYRDLDLTVRAKALRGQEDQGGGLIWRCRDENNYYICRFNPLEANYRVYKVIGGRRKQLDSVRVQTEAGRWYTLRATMQGDHITCYLDGHKLLETRDTALPDAGMIGLWTKADATNAFDDLEVKPLEGGR